MTKNTSTTVERETFLRKGQLLKKASGETRLVVVDWACDRVKHPERQIEKIKSIAVPGKPSCSENTYDHSSCIPTLALYIGDLRLTLIKVFLLSTAWLHYLCH